MLVLKSIRRHQDRSTVHREVPASVHFHCALGFDTRTLAQMVDSLVRVSRRAAYHHYASILAETRTSPEARRIVCWAITLPEEPHSQHLSPAAPDDAGLPAANGPVRRPAEHRRQVWGQALPFQQFHVLFNSLSKVLFIFRSLYLCAIGLWPIFSLRRNLPPILSCIPKQLDSSKELRVGCEPITYGILTLCDVLFQET
jgi:hypothetical protein